MKKVLLLNPPGRKLYLRDYYCSKVSKAGYVYHPVDLTFQSALLKNRFELKVIDAIAERKDENAVFAKIKEFSPDAILCLIAAVSWEEDVNFLKKLRDNFSGLIIATGDIFCDDPITMMKLLPSIDAALLDFTSTGLRDFINDRDSIPNDMIVRKNEKFVQGATSNNRGEFSIGVPAYELFPNEKYRYPFVKRKPFATILTDYGCPFPCGFCIMNKVGYRTRPIEEVLEELRRLQKNGFRELYINDQTFGANKKRTLLLLEAMKREKLNFGWVCFTRTDVLDDEFAGAIKSAGCHTVMFGVESASKSILESYNKTSGADNAFDAVRTCKKHGLRTVATYLVGFPEDTAQTINDTIDLSVKLDTDFASFNFAVPRRGTGIRKRALELGLASAENIAMDQAGEEIAMPTGYLKTEELEILRRKALRKFYLRPRYILKRILSMRNAFEMANTFRHGIEVFKNSLPK